MTIDSEVSPDGRYLAFMSDRSLTGYDNVDAVSGMRNEEAFLYDAVTGKLVCARRAIRRVRGQWVCLMAVKTPKGN